MSPDGDYVGVRDEEGGETGERTGRRSFLGRWATRPWMRTEDSRGTSESCGWRSRRTTSCVVPEGSLMGTKERALDIFLGVGG